MSHLLLTADNEHMLSLSQSLIDAAIEGNEVTVQDLLSNKSVDINHQGTVNLRMRQVETILHEEASDEVEIEYVLFKTDVTPLFAAAHTGHSGIVKKLLAAGADVNEKIFRGYPITAAAREGHCEALDILLKSGAYQPACEEAFLEACLAGQARTAGLLMKWEMARPETLTRALIHASSRGFLDIVELLVKSGVDVNSWHRVLLRSLKPSLHSNVDCTALIAAIVSRQVAVVKYLLEVGARIDCKVRLGAWSWDVTSEEALRVGAGMAEPYDAAWCAIEYWESKGEILQMLLEHVSANSEMQGRSLLCHAILCGNCEAAQVLLKVGAHVEYCTCTCDGPNFRPIHLASKQGILSALKVLISYNCDLNARTARGETALMLCIVYGQKECFHELLLAGADFSAVNEAGQTVIDIAEGNNESLFLSQAVCEAILAGQKLSSSDLQVFSPLHFIAHHGNSDVMKRQIESKDVDIDQQDKFGFSALMIAAQEGLMDVFKELVLAGAHIGLKNVKGDTAMTIAEGRGFKEQCELVVCEAIFKNVLKGADFKPIHFAATRGNCALLAHLLKKGHSINSLDSEGCTPLMVCVKKGRAQACKFLLGQGADCYFVNTVGETALSLARKNGSEKLVEEVIIDHIARKVVLTGGPLSKHTKRGKGTPHMKSVKLLKTGVLSWGSSKKRNIFCKEAFIGGSQEFEENRKIRHAGKSGVYTFRVVTMSGREVHFDANANFSAELWTRGINLVVKDGLATKC